MRVLPRVLAVLMLTLPMVATSAHAGARGKARVAQPKAPGKSKARIGQTPGRNAAKSNTAQRGNKLSRLVSKRKDGNTSIAMRGKGKDKVTTKNGTSLNVKTRGGLSIEVQNYTQRLVRSAKTSRAGASRQAIKQANARAKTMRAAIKQGQTPFIDVVSAQSGVKLKLTQVANYRAGTPARYRVEGTLENNTVDLLALMPISGHITKEATPWATSSVSVKDLAKTTDFNVRVIHPNGRVDNVTVGGAGMVTQAAMSIKLSPGVTRLQISPKNSAGPGSYPAGREIQFEYGG